MSHQFGRVHRGELERAIYDVFAQIPIPADTEIFAHDNRGDPDAIELRRRVGGKMWPVLLQELLQLKGGDLYWYHSAYGLFLPPAFHYYLPAFMIVSLDPVEADTVCESLFYALEPEFYDDWFTDFAALVTPAQRRVIRSFTIYESDLARELRIGDVTESNVLRQYWFPEGFPRPAPDDLTGQ